MKKRIPLEAQPFGDKGLVRYPAPGSPDWIMGRPGELFEDIEEIHNGKAIQRDIVRVVDGKDIIIWREIFNC